MTEIPAGKGPTFLWQ